MLVGAEQLERKRVIHRHEAVEGQRVQRHQDQRQAKVAGRGDQRQQQSRQCRGDGQCPAVVTNLTGDACLGERRHDPHDADRGEQRADRRRREALAGELQRPVRLEHADRSEVTEVARLQGAVRTPHEPRRPASMSGVAERTSAFCARWRR